MPRTSHNIANRYKYQGHFMSTMVESSALRLADFDDMSQDWQISLNVMNSNITGTSEKGKMFNKLLEGLQSAMALLPRGEGVKDALERLEIQSSLFRFLIKK